MLGVRPALGRLLSPDDDRQRLGHPVAVLSHGYWTSRFGADPSVVNRSILVNGQAYTVIGVAQPGFEGIELGRATDIFVPMMMKKQLTPGWDGMDERTYRWVRVFGRLKPGESLASAQAGLAAWTAAQLTADLATKDFANASADVRKEYARNRVVLEAAAQGHSNFRRELTTPLLVLMGIAAGVLRDRVRQRGEPAAGARGGPPARDGDATGDRRQPHATDPATAGRKPAARGCVAASAGC